MLVSDSNDMKIARGNRECKVQSILPTCNYNNKIHKSLLRASLADYHYYNYNYHYYIIDKQTIKSIKLLL